MNRIRIAKLEDLSSIVEIYNQAILTRKATADTHPFTVDERVEWFNEHSPGSTPIYVHGEAGHITGWLSISHYRQRPALSRTAEVSYYVADGYRRMGIGSALLGHAINEAPRLQKKVYLAILLEWNSGSIRLLEKFGFDRWGYLPEVAEFGDRLCGQYYYGRRV